jgi:phage tail protein X
MLIVVLIFSNQISLSETNDIKLLKIELEIVREKIKKYEDKEIIILMKLGNMFPKLDRSISNFLSNKIDSVNSDLQLTGSQKSTIIKLLQAEERENKAKYSLLNHPETKTPDIEPSTIIDKKIKDDNEEDRRSIAAAVKNSPEKGGDEELIEIAKPAFIIKHGDTLSDIALKVYNNSNYYIHIYNANKDILSSPDQLPDGLELKIPGLSDIEQD